MNALLEDIKAQCQKIWDYLQDLPSLIKISAQQVVLTQLSELAKSLGLVTAGEFRVGNGKDPGQGFTGVRIAYPPMLYNGEYWYDVSVDNDVLQTGRSASNGKFYAALGFLTIDQAGLNIYGATGSKFVNFYDDNDPTDYVGYIYADRDAIDGTISLCGLSDNVSLSGRAGLEGQRASDGKIATFFVGGTQTASMFLNTFIVQPSPGEDDVQSILFRQSNNTPILTIDTQNGRVGIKIPGGTGPSAAFHVVGDVLIGGDSSGYTGTVGLTNVTSAPVTGAVGMPTMSVTRGNTGWYKIMVGTTPAYVPYWTDIS